RALLISRGDLSVFIQRPISATFVTISALVLLFQIVAYLRRLRLPKAVMPGGDVAAAGQE
ncbi:MAG: tripartite tricarboxylate transporter permease, partial [Burkholderiales bacterium]|nr:tripartite tricarboxylate transporter permease [Burkholderiales bacterium]